MPTEGQKLNGRLLNGTHPLVPSTVVYKLGVYGWRKRCLYFLIFLIGTISLVNLALILWIWRVQVFRTVRVVFQIIEKRFYSIIWRDR